MLEYLITGVFGAGVIIELYNFTLGRLNSTMQNFYCGEITTEEYIKELKQGLLRYSPFCRKDIKKQLSFTEELFQNGIKSIPELVKEYTESL